LNARLGVPATSQLSGERARDNDKRDARQDRADDFHRQPKVVTRNRQKISDCAQPKDETRANNPEDE
jgi:hypothetical protein